MKTTFMEGHLRSSLTSKAEKSSYDLYYEGATKVI
jgi:hypothetical protein